MKTNPLAADRLGPNALVRMEGKTYKVDRPTSRGWELVETGSRRRRDITHAQLQRGEDDRTVVVTRSKSEDPSLQSLSLKSRRDIFIKTWWLNKIMDALRTKTLDSTGDVALRKFFDRHLSDMRESLAAWEKDSGYDHSIDREKKPRKPNVGSKSQAVEPVLHPRTIRYLLPKYLAKNRHPLALRKRTEKSRAGGRRIDERVRKIVEEEIAKYAGEANTTIEGLRELVKARIVLRNAGMAKNLRLKVPCWGTLERLKDEIPAGRNIGGRKGARAINEALGPYGEGPQYSRVGERCEIDCWNIPLFLLLEKAGVTGEIPDQVSDELRKRGKRIHVAVVVEKATGYILSMKFGLGETAELTTAALKMALTDKTNISNWAGCEQRWNLFTGIEECTTDAGSGFIGDRFLSAVIPATTSHVFAASGLPHLRGLVESIFSTLHKGFISKFVARAFENVVAKGKYEAEYRAVHQLEEFFGLMTRYVVDVYHNKPRQNGLRQSPHNEFVAKASSMETKAPPTPEEIRVWFGFEAKRKLGPMGVRFMHIQYDSNWLVKYRTHMGLEEVLIRVDEDDLGAISVLLDGEWITVPALDTDFVGVSLDQWIELLEDLRMQFGEQAEIDFERYVAPALLDIEKANRKAERALKLNDVFWSEERFEDFEDQNQINFVNRTRPEVGVPAPSFGEGTIGRRFDRPAQPRLPEPPTATPSPAVEPTQPDHDQQADQQPRRRLTYRED